MTTNRFNTKINNVEDLRAAILELENKKQHDKQLVIESFQSLKKSITPLNLVKSLFADIKESPGITANVLNAAAGMGIGLLTKRFFIGKSAGLLKNLLGSAVEAGTAGLVTNNTGILKSVGNWLIKNVFRSKSKEGHS